MFICKVCQNTFEMVNRIPLIMKCGHTFCKLCIIDAIDTQGYFPCQNCFFKLKNVDHLIINQILCDRSSFQEKQNQALDNEIQSKIAQAFYIQKKDPMGKKMIVEEAIEEQFIDNMRIPPGNSKRQINYSNKCLHQACNRHAERDYCSITCQQNHTSPRNQNNNLRDLLRTTKPQTRFGQSCLFDNNFTKSKNLSVFMPNFNQSKSKFGGRNFMSKSKNRQKCLRNNCNNWRRNDLDEQFEFCGEICQIRYQSEYSQLIQLNLLKKTSININMLNTILLIFFFIIINQKFLQLIEFRIIIFMDQIEEKIIRLIQHDQDHHRSLIVLDGIYLEQISLKFKNQMEDYEEVFKLSLKNCHLKNLKNLPEMPFLNNLNLSNNQFSTRELKKITLYKNLQSLDLSQNKIKTLKQINNLKELKYLIFLNLEGNPIQKIKNYRDKIFDIFPALQLLDLKDKFNNYLVPSSTEAEEIYSQGNFNSGYSNSLNSFTESDQESDIYVPENSDSSEENEESVNQQSQQTDKSVIDIFDQLIQK